MTYKIEKNRHSSLEPFLLEVFLTNRCNMNCSYCASRYMISQKHGKSLTFEQLRHAIDIYASCKKNNNLPETRRISLTGGEPLLEFELLKRTINYIRKKYKGFEIKVVTNATLLDREKVDFLVDNDVLIVISLDGCREIHDLHRVFNDNSSASVFDVVLNNLEKIPFRKRKLTNFCVSTVLTSQTIKFLPDTIRFLEKLGFKQVALGFDEYEIWEPDKIKQLERTLEKIKKQHFRKMIGTGDLDELICFSFVASYSLESQRMLSDYYEVFCREITLMYDGYFYPGEAIFGMMGEEKYRIGNLRDGINFGKMREIYSSAFSYIRKYGESVGVIWPVSRYFHAINRGISPDDLLRNACEVNHAFDKCFGGYWRIQKIYLMLKTNPSFGDFAHSPKYRSGKEIKSFRLTVRNDSDTARLREGIDYFLYSPGNAKKLVLDVMDNLRQSIDVMEGMVLYVLMKARYLKKRIKLTVACEAGDTSAFSGGGWDANRWRYLNEHGVQAGTCFAGESPRNQSEAGPPLAKRGDLGG